MINYLRRPGGFTVIEMVIGLSLFAVLSTVLWGAVACSMRAYRAGENRVELQQTARIALDKITRELMFARQITIGGDGKSITFITDQYVNGQIITYVVDSFGILRRNAGGGPQPITGGNNVKVDLNFHWGDDGAKRLINISLTAGGFGQEIFLQTAVVALNVPII